MNNLNFPIAAFLVVTGIAIGGCSSVRSVASELTPTARGELLPQPFRSIGLALHQASLAIGVHAIGHAPAKADASKKYDNKAKLGCRHDLTVTWLGHSSVLVCIDGMTILTDPISSKIASLASPLPVRLAEPPVPTDELPGIDVVMISHGDYDHLHLPSLRELAQRFPDALVLVPTGVGRDVMVAGFKSVRVVQTNESIRFRKLRMTALPALHATRRNVFGTVDGGAVSWEIAGRSAKVMFIGDSAYGAIFERIGRERGPYEVALVPIGAYEPRHLVADMHSTPEEALLIARDLRAQTAIGIHWGTLALSPDRPAEATARFRNAKVPGPQKVLLEIGQTWR